MNSIIPHIEYLLLSHDCVIVPGIGALLAHGEHAYYADDEGVWHAPRRVVSFNPELSRTDGLLAASVARRDGISIESASRAVQSDAEEMRAQLESRRHLSLGGAGELSMDSEGYLIFEPGQCDWLSPSCLWLPDFALAPLAKASDLEEERRREERNAIWPARIMTAAKIAACACLFVVLGWVVMKNLTYAPENQFATVGPVETLRSQDKSATADKEHGKATLILASAPADEVVENIEVEQPAAIGAPTDYYVIVASLNTRGEAEKFITHNNQFSLGILEKDGRFRIYAASGASVAEVTDSFRESAAARVFPDFWVCRR